MHTPVLVNEVLYHLNPQPNENFIDATFGFGGHGCAILKKIQPEGKLLGIELDPEVWEQVQVQMAQNSKRLILVNDSYVHLGRIVTKYNFSPVNGILFDLGFSSWHIEKSGRGFSFLRDEPLDMRYQKVQSSKFKACPLWRQRVQSCLTAEEIVNTWPLTELAKIFREYGEERFASRIAREIVAVRNKQPIKTTFQLAKIIRHAIPGKFQHQRIHPATRVFQALRIAVNDELNCLKAGLAQALEVLAAGGRLVVISFHSGEDRIVKNFFREQKQKGILEILTKKPIRPSAEEIKNNPRSHSAKLRAAKII